MKKWELHEEVSTPDGQKLSLHSRDGVFFIRVNGAELMSTRRHASEEKFAEVACTAIAHRPSPSLLIGGLGFGFTLRAALSRLGGTARVTVAELMPAIVQWNRSPKYSPAPETLDDPRVKVVEGDVAELLARSRSCFDAILLDVDNGPDALTVKTNHTLYGPPGLERARAALKPAGILGIWSAAEAPSFERRLERAGFRVEKVRARAHATSGGWHTLYFGHLP